MSKTMRDGAYCWGRDTEEDFQYPLHRAANHITPLSFSPSGVPVVSMAFITMSNDIVMMTRHVLAETTVETK